MLPLSIQRQIDTVDITILMSVIYFSLNTQGPDYNSTGLGIIISTLDCPFYLNLGRGSSKFQFHQFQISLHFIPMRSRVARKLWTFPLFVTFGGLQPSDFWTKCPPALLTFDYIIFLPPNLKYRTYLQVCPEYNPFHKNYVRNQNKVQDSFLQ